MNRTKLTIFKLKGWQMLDYKKLENEIVSKVRISIKASLREVFQEILDGIDIPVDELQGLGVNAPAHDIDVEVDTEPGIKFPVKKVIPKWMQHKNAEVSRRTFSYLASVDRADKAMLMENCNLDAGQYRRTINKFIVTKIIKIDSEGYYFLK